MEMIAGKFNKKLVPNEVLSLASGYSHDTFGKILENAGINRYTEMIRLSFATF